MNNDEDAMDDHGHGTFVAGIAAADTHNGVGMAGVCRGCRILPVKVLSAEGKGSAASVAQGIQYAAQSGAQIINLSLGFPSTCGCSETLARAINYAFETGSLLIAASGNDSDKRRTSYPASSSRVMAVGASDHNDREADFSNRDSYLDLMAPGKDIYSLERNASYRTASGTSAAAPFVSGVAGLVLSVNPQLKNTEVWWRLYQSADDFPAASSAIQESPSQSIAVVAPASTSLPFRLYLPIVTRLRSTAGRLNAAQALLFTSAGRTFAPVDTCQGEPSNCAPGCGAEIARAGSITALQDLSLLRRFRDEVLASNAVGQRWIGVYERHRLEFATLLASNEALRGQARAVLDLWLPLIRSLVDESGRGSTVIQNEHVQAGRAMITRLHELGSPALRGDLQSAVVVVDLAERYVGQDVHEFWKALEQQSR